MHRAEGKKKTAALNISIWFWIFNKFGFEFLNFFEFLKILTYKEVKKKKNNNNSGFSETYFPHLW